MVVLSLIFCVGCAENPLKSDISGLTYQPKIANLDSMIVHTAEKNLPSSHRKWLQTLGDPYAYVLYRCLKIQTENDSLVAEGLYNFRNEPYISKLEKEIAERFKKVDFKNRYTSAFRRIQFHLPSAKLPEKIVLANTLFESSIFVLEKDLVIGLERYLGGNHPLVAQLPPDVFFDWVKADMDSTFLDRDVLIGWIHTHIVPESKGNLAEEMIRWGKVLLVAEAAFPDIASATLLRYTPEEFQWAESNQLKFWNYLKDQQLLFKNDERLQANLLEPAPFTIGLPEKGPDRLGQYLGWVIVRDYCFREGTPLRKLLVTPYTEILQSFEIKD